MDCFVLSVLWYLTDRESFSCCQVFLCISRRKLYFITTPKVIFYSKNLSQGKENKAQLRLSLLTPADTDTSLTLGLTCHTWSSVHQHTFLYLLRLISRLVSRWSYPTVLKIVIKSLQPRPRDCNFPIDPPVSAASTWIGVQERHCHRTPPCPPLPLVALSQQQCPWLPRQPGRGWGRGEAGQHTQRRVVCGVCVEGATKEARIHQPRLLCPGLCHPLPSASNTMDVYDNPLGIFTVIQWVS